MNDTAVVVSNDNKNVTPIETIDAIKKSGFNKVFIQWYNKDYKEFELNPIEQVKYARSIGLDVIFVHLSYKGINNIWLDNEIGEELVKKFINDLDDISKCNIHLVIMHLTSGENAPKYNLLGIKRLKLICDYAKKLNINVAFENTKIEGYLEYVINNVDNDNIGLCYDSGHDHAHFNDNYNFEKFKNKILAVHLHDNNGNKDEHLIPFDGTINWISVMKKLKESGYNGPITLELCYRNNYLENDIDTFYKKGYESALKLMKIAKK